MVWSSWMYLLGIEDVGWKSRSVVSVFFKLEIGIINNIDWFVWLVYEVD